MNFWASDVIMHKAHFFYWQSLLLLRGKEEGEEEEGVLCKFWGVDVPLRSLLYTKPDAQLHRATLF